MTSHHPETMAELVAAREVLIVTGAGGVGKTTMAAALALEAARRREGRVLVITVDPARRLADALGVDHIGHGATRIEAPDLIGEDARGELWAAMLDARAGWDALVQLHAPDDDTRDRLVSNPLYRDVTGRFVHSHEYLAMERLHELHSSGVYDLIVVDTPPSAHAVDVIDAPARMIEFFESRWLNWLTAPSRSRVVGLVARPFYQVLERVLGPRFGEDLAEMFGLLDRLRPGFVARAREVARLVASSATGIVVVTTSETTAMVEVDSLMRELTTRHLEIAGAVLNRVMPAEIVTDSGSSSARALGELLDRTSDLEDLAAGWGEEEAVVCTTLARLGERFADVEALHRRDRASVAVLEAATPLVTCVELFDVDIADLSTLSRVGSTLWAGVPDRPDWSPQEE